MKKYNFVYKTTNLINGKNYIGIHSTDDLYDGYLGSGNRIKLAIDKYGVNNFKREIIKMCKNRKSAFDYEAKIVTTEFIKDKSNYNITEGGQGVTTHSVEGLERLSNFRKERLSVKNLETNEFEVILKEDFDNTKYVGQTKGMISVKDIDGNTTMVTCEEYNNGNYVGVTKGYKTVRSKITGVTLYIRNDEFDSNVHESVLTGRISVKDKNGNTFSIFKDDPRYLSGELVGIMNGTKTWKQKNLQKRVKCPHCDKDGIISNMKRWHFDNCKFKNS